MLREALAAPKGRLRMFVYRGDSRAPEDLLHDSGWIDNVVTDVGRQWMLDRMDGVAVPALTGLLIGNGTVAVAQTDTALSGATTAYQAFDAGFPSRAGKVATYQATVPTGSANFTHSEFGLTTAASGGVLVTHLLAGPFTKTSAVSIVYVYTLTMP